MFSFEPFNANHLVFLRHWLKSDHIKEFWQETDDDEKLKAKFLEELPIRGVHSFIIVKDRSYIGYIQYYDATKVGGGWWEKEPPGTFGIDLMIGAPEFYGRGLGSIIIKEFIVFILRNEVSARSIITDPDPNNFIAIKAFEKVGFIREAEITTPGGKALLMRMNLPV